MREVIYLFFLCYSMDVIKISMLNKLLFGIEVKKAKKGLFAGVIVILLSIMAAVIQINYQDSKYMIVIYEINILIMSCVLFEGKWKEKVIFSFFSLCIESMLDGLYHTMLSVTELGKMQREFGAIFMTVGTILAWIMIAKKTNVKELKGQSVVYYIFLIGILIADSIVLGFLEEILGKESVLYQSNSLKAAFIFVGAGMIGEVMVILYLMMSRNVYRERDYYNQEYNKMQQGYYESLIEKDVEMRKFRHDIQHHFIVLKELYGKNEQEYMEYLEQVSRQFKAIPKNIQSGNTIADVILNQYDMIMKQENIQFQVKGKFPESCYIEKIDICIILSNILKNALEAVRVIEKKEVKLEFRYDEEQIYICESNYYGKVTDISLGERTWKKNKENHGFGLENTRNSVKKYNGAMEIIKEDNYFRVLIAIKNKTIQTI